MIPFETPSTLPTANMQDAELVFNIQHIKQTPFWSTLLISCIAPDHSSERTFGYPKNIF